MSSSSALRRRGLSIKKLSPRGALGTVADLLAVITAILSAWVLVTKDDIPQSVLAVIISGLALTFIAISFRLHGLLVASQESHRRQLQDVKAMPLLSSATAQAAKATVVAAEAPNEFVLHINNACTYMAQLFGVASGSACRITVLEVYAPTGQHRRPNGPAPDPSHGLATRLLCASYAERPLRPDIDWVVDNTDFQGILAGEPFFFCNDLPAEVARGYKNSHWDRARITEWQANDSWPYRATIVWPIINVPTDPDAERDLTGFLCLDTTERGTFERDFDVPTGETFAHAMYSGMAAYRAAQQQAARRPTSGSAISSE